MTEYDDELQQGRALAATAAAASNQLDEHASRIGVSHPVPPDSIAAVDVAYTDAYQREVAASQAFWKWVKEHSTIITDHELGGILRILSGQ